MRTVGLALWALVGCTSKDEVRPVADAGPDQLIVAGTSAALDGSESRDQSGEIATFAWSLISMPEGSVAGLLDAEGSNPALATDLPGNYVVSLVVTDNDGNESAPDVVEVVASTLSASRPEAHIEAQGDLGIDLPLMLDGSASTAPEGRDITAWDYTLVQAPKGASAGIVLGDKPWQASLTPDAEGTWIIGLTVADDEADSRQATVALPVSAFPDLAPIARCGADLSVATGSLVELDGTDSFDPEGSELTYSWSLEAPARSETALSREDTATPRFIADVKGDYTASLVVSDGAISSEACTATIAASKNPSNQVPIAFAGGSQSIALAGSTVTLDGTDSFDPDDDPITFRWTILSAPVGSSLTESDITSADQSVAEFVPDAGGTFIIGLEVCDDAPLCAEDTAEISVGNPGGNQPPVADAGEDTATEVGLSATVDGSSSYDPDGDPLTYSWTIDTQPAGSTAIIEDPNQSTSSIQPDVDGLYVLRLTVDDGLATDSDLVQVEVVPEGTNLPPVCNELDDIDVALGDVVLLDGSDTTDPNGDELSFLWTILSSPGGSSIGIDDPTAEITALRPDLPGEYRVQFQAMDGTENCFFQFLVNVEDTSPNNPPDCDAGGDLTVAVGEPVELDGTGSSDPDGDPLTYSWVLVDAPGGITSSITDSTSAVATLIPEAPGLYTVELTVSDGEDSCATGIVISAEVVVENDPPLCRLSADSIVEVGQEASMDASASSDPDGDTLSYSWALISSPEGASSSFSDAAGIATTWSADTPGAYQIQLEVSDGIDSCSEVFEIDVTETSNNPPECDAGSDLTAELGEEVELDASATTDPDGDSMTFQWRIFERPEGSTATLSDLTLKVARFTADVAGDYIIRFNADDGTDTCQDEMVLTVTDASTNTPPSADAGAPISLCTADTVSLDGSGSSDADGDGLTYSWSLISVPSGSSLTDADIGSASSALASFTPDATGTYVAELTVDDGIASDTDSVTVSIDGDDSVLMLHLDETSGSSAADGSPSGLDGTLTGGTWSGGRFFGALGFDGSTWVTVPDDDRLDITDDFTIDWWMRTDDIDSTWQAVLTKGTSYNYSIWTYQDEVYFYGVTTSLGYVNAGGAASIGDGAWHHYAVTVSDGVITVYEDGVVLDSAAYSGTLRTTAEDLHLGRPNYSTAIYMFEGALDEVVIRDRTLSEEEIVALWDADTQVCTDEEDTSAPTVSITSPGGSADIGFVRVEGTASDASAIVEITVDGAQAAATSENYSTWVAYVPLAEGSSTLVVQAEDVAGNINSSADSISVSYEDTCGDDTTILLAFDEESGGTAVDWSEGGHDASESGTGRVIGQFGNALSLDGTGSAEIAHDGALSLSDAFSIETWYRQDTASATAETIIHKGAPANYGLGTWGGFLLFGFTDTTGTDVNIYSSASYADGSWHHIVGVYDGTDLSLYVDGSLVATSSTGGAVPATNTSPIHIGAYLGASLNFTGELDQLRLFDGALSTSEVVDLFDDGEACPLGDNLSSGATATASTTLNPLFTASNTVDGSTQEASEFDYTMWLTQDGEPGWMELDFGEVVGVLGVRWANTHNRTFFNRSTADYRIIASRSRAFESEGVEIDSGTGTLETDLVFHTATPTAPVAARYLRIYVDSFDGLGGGINELEVYGLE